MMRAAEFAHVFLFRCPSCHGALSSICFESEANLEMADERAFRLACACGWAGELMGFTAVGHWVQVWEPIAVPEIANASKKGKEAA